MMPYGPRTIDPDPEPTVPPDPTRYDLVWGKAYPCLRYVETENAARRQCAGMMQRTTKRPYQYGKQWWHHFKCNKCGREADDMKERDGVGV